MNYLANQTEEQRAENLVKAQQARIEKKAAGEHLKQDFADENHWRDLASKYGVRLPASYLPCSETKHVKRALRTIGASQAEFLEYHDEKNLKVFALDNPDWPAWAAVGVMLEWWDEKNGK